MGANKPYRAEIRIIGVNPYVEVPVSLLNVLQRDAGGKAGKIPVRGTVDGHQYSKYLVKYSGEWRLYLNGITRKAAGKDVGDTVSITIGYDPVERVTEMPPSLERALEKNKKALAVYEALSPSLQKEIRRYLNNLKSSEALERNAKRAIAFLTGGERFIGRDPVQRR